MNARQRAPSPLQSNDRAIRQLREHVAGLAEGRPGDQESMQKVVDKVFHEDSRSVAASLKDEFEAAELALRICFEIGAPRSSMRAHQRECDRILDVLSQLH